MKQSKHSFAASSEAASDSPTETVDRAWTRLVRRRSFLHGIGAAATVLPTTALFAAEREREDEDRPLTRDDAALLQLALAIETIEADLWQQYNQICGAVDHNENPNTGNSS